MTKRKPPHRDHKPGHQRSDFKSKNQSVNDGREGDAQNHRRGSERHGGEGPFWLFGSHAVGEAIRNPERRILRLAFAGAIPVEFSGHLDRPLPEWENVRKEELERWLPAGAVHQGIAAKVSPLPDRSIEDLIEAAEGRDQAVLMILDQVTDPHNVGAILRSAAAFGALGVILTERHAAPESGTLAKAASGALEHVPLVRVANLARALEILKKGGFWIAGLAAEAERTLADAKLTGRIGLALGAEGPGLRRLTREHCDLLVKLPTSGPIGHLNVSNAAAVALYEVIRR